MKKKTVRITSRQLNQSGIRCNELHFTYSIPYFLFDISIKKAYDHIQNPIPSRPNNSYSDVSDIRYTANDFIDLRKNNDKEEVRQLNT